MLEASSNLHPDPGLGAGFLKLSTLSLNVDSFAQTTGITGAPTLVNNGLLLKVTANALAGDRDGEPILSAGWSVPVSAGLNYSAGSLVTKHEGSVDAALFVTFINAANGVISAHSVVTPRPFATAYQLALTQLAPALSVRAQFVVSLAARSGVGVLGSALFANFMFSPSETLPTWFSGDSGGAEWTGARWNSTSRRRGSADAMEEIAEWVPPVFVSEDVA